MVNLGNKHCDLYARTCNQLYVALKHWLHVQRCVTVLVTYRGKGICTLLLPFQHYKS